MVSVEISLFLVSSDSQNRYYFYTYLTDKQWVGKRKLMVKWPGRLEYDLHPLDLEQCLLGKKFRGRLNFRDVWCTLFTEFWAVYRNLGRIRGQIQSGITAAGYGDFQLQKDEADLLQCSGSVASKLCSCTSVIKVGRVLAPPWHDWEHWLQLCGHFSCLWFLVGGPVLFSILCGCVILVWFTASEL